MLYIVNFATIPFAAYLFFGLFVVTSIAELVFAFMEKETPRKIVKPFCVLFLAIMVACWHPTAYLVYLGLFFGAIGDLLLVFKHKVWTFVMGCVAFFVSHVLFILQYVFLCWPLEWYWWAIMGFILILFLLLGYRPLHKAIKTPGLVGGGLLYFASILLDLYFAIVAASKGYFDYCFLNVLGMISFVGSDVFLVRTLFVKDTKRRDFYIMGTYLFAQMLVAVGFCFTL